MALSDLFRARHHHSNPAVRIEALEDVEPDNVALLLSVAKHDTDPNVRRIAIDKLSDPEELLSVAESEAEHKLAVRATKRAVELLSTNLNSKDLTSNDWKQAATKLQQLGEQRVLVQTIMTTGDIEKKSAILTYVDDDKALATVAKDTSNKELRDTAIARITDKQHLLSIAIETERKDTGKYVVDSLSDPDALRKVAENAKNRRVRTLASKKLTQTASPREEENAQAALKKRNYAERLQIVHIVEGLAKGHEWTQSMSTMKEAQEQWQSSVQESLQSELPEWKELSALSDRYRLAVEQYGRRRTKFGKEIDVSPVAAPNNILAGGSEPTPIEQSGSAEDSAFASGDGTNAEGEAALEMSSLAKGQEDNTSNSASESVQSKTDSYIARLEVVTGELQSLKDTTSIKDADRALQRVRSVVGPLSKAPARAKAAVAIYEESRKQLLMRIQELREAQDWQRWANGQRMESLIEDAKRLLTDDTKNLANRLKRLQGDWKRVGFGPREKSEVLWQQFKELCDQVYERVQQDRIKQRAEQAENLEKKRALCEQAEALTESTEWAATASQLKELQRQWQEIGSVGRKYSQTVWQRFQAACDGFFEARKPHLEKVQATEKTNLSAKIALCEAAEALIATLPKHLFPIDAEQAPEPEAEMASEPGAELVPEPAIDSATDTETAEEPQQEVVAAVATTVSEPSDLPEETWDWGQSAEELQQLQYEWKSIGHVPRKDFAALNDRFYAATTSFYAAREKSRIAQKEQAQKRYSDTQKALQELQGNTDATASDFLAARKQIVNLDAAWETHEKLLTEFCMAAKLAVDNNPDLFVGTSLDASLAKKRKQKLLAQVRAFVTEEVSSDDIAGQLQSAWAENALGGVWKGRTADGRSIAKVIQEYKESWLRIGPVAGAEGTALDNDFQIACAKAIANNKSSEE